MSSGEIISPKLKICGITNIYDLVWCLDNGVDFVGINLVRHSRRYVQDNELLELLSAVKERECQDRIVFVLDRLDPIEIQRLIAQIGFKFTLQFHATPDFGLVGQLKQQFNQINFWAAVPSGMIAQTTTLNSYMETFDFLIFDKADQQQFGGTGKVFEWDQLKLLPSDLSFGVAGGINIENIELLLQNCFPDLIDVASGSESEPRKKSHSLIKKMLKSVSAFGG